MSDAKSNPGTRAQPVTPNDVTIFSPPYRCLLIATGGNIAVDTAGGDVNVVLTVPTGYFLCEVTRVYAAGTTAMGITGIY